MRFDFTESRGWESLLYIRILQVSSLVVVAGFAEWSSHTLIIHVAQPRQHQHVVRHYDVERGARRHHGASIERYPASPSNTKKFSFHGSDQVLTNPFERHFLPNISRFWATDVGGFGFLKMFFRQAWRTLTTIYLYFGPGTSFFLFWAPATLTGFRDMRLSSPRTRIYTQFPYVLTFLPSPS